MADLSSLAALGTDLRAAVANAYAVVAGISFRGMHYRKDIGHRALSREEET